MFYNCIVVTENYFDGLFKPFAIFLIGELVFSLILISVSPDTIPFAYRNGYFAEYRSKWLIFSLPAFSSSWFLVGFFLYKLLPTFWKLYPKNLIKFISKIYELLFGIKVDISSYYHFLEKLSKAFVLTGIFVISTLYLMIIAMILELAAINSAALMYSVFIVLFSIFLLRYFLRKSIK